MDRLHKLLFELSSPERINILLQLRENHLKLSHVSRKMDLTVTESSRHLQRLCEAKLIQKDTEGRFSVTPFGVLALTLLSGLVFASKHMQIFVEYDISKIPVEFIERLGELEGITYSADVFRNLEEGEKRIREAQNFVWILSDEVLGNTIPVLAEKMKGPFDLRIILPKGKFPPESDSRLPLNLGIKKRVLPRVDVVIVLTEEYAIFCLPTQKGKIDYTGFTGTEPKFKNWCKELFLHYWNKGTPIN